MSDAVLDLQAIQELLAIHDTPPAVGETRVTSTLHEDAWTNLRALLAVVRETRQALAAITAAYDRCDGNRGAFSCHDPHDLRCPKDRAATAADWKGDWVCVCGREELDAALANSGAVLARCQDPQ